VKIYAERVESADPQIHNYQIKNGGGILDKSRPLTITYTDGALNALAPFGRRGVTSTVGEKPGSSRVPRQVAFKETMMSGPGFRIGTSSKASIPVLSQGFGIPKIF
jgi:hypothetical protein